MLADDVLELERKFTGEYINYLGKNTHDWLENIKPELTFTDKIEDKDKLQDVYNRLINFIISLRGHIEYPRGVKRLTLEQIQTFWGQKQCNDTLKEIVETLRKNT